MATIVQNRCEKIMEFLRSEMYLDEIPISEIQTAIKSVAGYKRETVEQYVEALVHFNYLKRKNQTVFTIVGDAK